LRIRHASAGDLPRVRVLLEQLGELLDRAPRLNRVNAPAVWNEMSARPEIYVNLVAEEAAGIVGFLSMVCYHTLFHPGGTAVVNELVVASHRRRSGIGGALIARATELARERGMDEIEVGVELANRTAGAFYRRQGFDLEYRLLGRELAGDPQTPEVPGARADWTVRRSQDLEHPEGRHD